MSPFYHSAEGFRTALPFSLTKKLIMVKKKQLFLSLVERVETRRDGIGKKESYCQGRTEESLQ
jgi:hypothetical protein